MDEERFCFFPFAQLLLQPTGAVSPCCWNQSIRLGDFPNQTLEEIWNGAEARKLRREFLEGNPVQCSTQMRHIQCHRWSRGMLRKPISLTEIQTQGPRRLDVRLNGRCNLQCVMCDVWKQPNGLYDDSDFWRRGPSEIFPHLIEVDVLGGEPFVQSDTYRLIDAVAAINGECTWAFVTNGNYRFARPIRERLEKVQIRWLQLSLDSVRPETYAQIRVQGDLARALRTLADLQEYQRERVASGRGFRLTASMCVQSRNWDEVGEFLAFARDRALEPVLQFAYDPESISLRTLDRSKRVAIERYFRSLLADFPAEVLNPVLLPIRESLNHD